MKFIEKLLEKIYHFFIVEVVFLDKECIYEQDREIKQFSSITFNTTDGKMIKFKFSEIFSNKALFIRKFIAEVETSDNFTSSFLELNEKAVIVFKVIIVPVNYKILSRVLYNVYVKHAYEYVNEKMKNKVN
jgi:hypothetical protein